MSKGKEPASRKELRFGDYQLCDLGLEKLPNFPGRWFPHLENEMTNNHLPGLL